MNKYKAYPEYKDSGVVWLGNVPKDWNIIPIKHLAELTPKKSTIDSSLMDKECSFLPMEKLKLNSIVLDEKRKVSDVCDGYTYFEDGDVLIAKVTPCFENKNMAVASGLTNSIGFGSSEIYVLRTNKRMNNRFLYYRLQEDSFMDIATAAMTGAGGLKRVPAEVINTYSLASPKFAEQTQIANFLDHETAKIDTLIEEQQSLIRLLKEKRQAVISHAVTKGLNPNAPMKDSGVEWLGEVPEHWNVCNLSHVLNAIGDVDHYMPKSIDEGVPYVMTGDLTEFASDINFAKCKQVSQGDYLNLSKRIKTSAGDVIMARYATIGTASYVDIDRDFLVSYSCVTIKPSPSKVLGLYLFYYFKSQTFLNGIQSHINTNTQGNVGVNDLKKVKITLPDLVEQQKIIAHLQSAISKFDHLTTKSESAIKLMQERRTALISAAVTGKIDVREWIAPVDSRLCGNDGIEQQETEAM
ncbi:restriction endonuclease subunit S [Parashewanella spongiae]|uniref:Restriction endonuclease subunit S n=1 Tax=Parashewanella spongiae TaxID=342950 RepID=A0A3A6UJ81_9GAMM|nr:restriction endonuclease subunit S [Parashewanella spongiae]MCL1076919.1 restriction endonuclease subunit S [Parashewanella spongiae]RJY19169.1 restriction endonuclease subunit S [Parashewanella spongiae]USN27178.1 restriction endonuclease subunit S [synthetic construct]